MDKFTKIFYMQLYIMIKRVYGLPPMRPMPVPVSTGKMLSPNLSKIVKNIKKGVKPVFM